MEHIKLAVAILSARCHPERRVRCRRLWTHGFDPSGPVCWRFFVGNSGSLAPFLADREPDTVEVPCPDDYTTLPQKTRDALQWFIDRFDFDYLFKCDDDTYVQLDRLLQYSPSHDYCGWNARKSFATSTDYASGGAGYFLSKRAASIAIEELALQKSGPEDKLVGDALARAGINLFHDDRFRFNTKPGENPAPNNDIITAHWVASAEAEAEVKRPWIRIPAPRTASDDLVLKVGSRIIRWVIGPHHDRVFTEKVLRPWVLPNATRLPSDSIADFTVGAYLEASQDISRVIEARGMRFLLAGEPETRYPSPDGCFQFVQEVRPDDDERTRYSPMLCLWTPPVDNPIKSRPCSVMESKGRPHRMELFKDLENVVKDVDGYGSVYGRPLPGFHSVGPTDRVFNKFEGLEQYGFHGAVERLSAQDYVTEKFSDPILCETVPLYSGCRPKLDDECRSSNVDGRSRASENN